MTLFRNYFSRNSKKPALCENPTPQFDELVRNYKEPVYWHIRRIVVIHEDAQDATQETFIRIFRSIHKFRGECPVSAWILRIASNEALRTLKAQNKETADIDLARTTPSDEFFDYSDLEAVKLQKAILTLPTKQQLAFNLRYYDEMPYEEIAYVLGSSPQSAKANYHFAKEKIIRYMNENF